MIRRRAGATGTAGDDGVTAVIVAILISAVLFTFGAFAVDFGNAFARQASLQSVADAAARAAALKLPDRAAARQAAVRTLCSDSNRVSGWPAYACPTPLTAVAWTDDGQPGNGEITFWITDTLTVPDSVPARIIRVKVTPPPARVAFGLGQAIGASGVDVTRRGSADPKTAYGLGVFPFALLESEVNPAPGTPPGVDGQFCIGAAGSVGPPPGEPPRGNSPPPTDPPADFFLEIASPESYSLPWDSQEMIRFRALDESANAFANLTNVTVYFGDRALDHVVTAIAVPGSPDFEALSPIFPPGVLELWVEADDPVRGHLISNTLSLTYTNFGPTNACSATGGARGLLDVPRAPDPAPGPSRVNDRLRDNIADGWDARPHAWAHWPENHDLVVPGWSPPVPTGLTCAQLVPAADVRDSIPNARENGVNCLTTTAWSATALRDGFFGPQGRMRKRCSTQTAAAPAGLGGTVDDTRLFAPGSGLVTADTTPAQLKTDLETGAPPPPGTTWLTARIFGCPRFGMVPVISPPGDVVVPGEKYPILAYRYVWIDSGDPDRGFIWSGSNLVGLRGYIIDPVMVPGLVSGAQSLAPFQDDLFPNRTSGGNIVSEQLLPRQIVLGPP